MRPALRILGAVAAAPPVVPALLFGDLAYQSVGSLAGVAGVGHNVPIGSFLSVACYCPPNWQTDGINSVTDSEGNTYTIDYHGADGLVIFSAPVTAALTTSDTITYNGGGNFWTMIVAAFSGVGLKRNTGAIGATAPVAAVAGDLILAFTKDSGNDSTAPWVPIQTDRTGYNSQASNAYAVAPSTGTFTYVASGGQGNGSVAISYHHA